MPEIPPPDFVGSRAEEPNGATPNIQAWITALWLRRRLGMPKEIASTSNVATLIEAWNIMAQAFDWWLSRKKDTPLKTSGQD